MAKILVTDDAKLMRNILGNILSKRGHEVVEAATGREAVDKALSDNFDLITLDITMPEMNGIEALTKIKKAKPHQKVIMVSAMGQKFMVNESIQEGAMDFIVKPFQTEVVVEAIERALKK